MPLADECWYLSAETEHVNKMETTVLSETTGIPVLEEGNADQTSNGSVVGESFRNGVGANVDFCGVKNYSAISVSDFICENVESINNSIQDGDQSRILCDIVSDTSLPVGQCDNLPSLEVIPTYLVDASVKGNFIETLSNGSQKKNICSPTCVEIVDEPLNLSTVDVKDVNKLTEGGTPDFSTLTIEEQQKKLNESISAIAKSLGLEDFLPENFQVDTCKDVLSISVVDTHSPTMENKVKNKRILKTTTDESCKRLKSHIKFDSPSFIKLNSPEFSDSKQTRSVPPVVRVITPNKKPNYYSKSVTMPKKFVTLDKSDFSTINSDDGFLFIERLLNDECTQTDNDSVTGYKSPEVHNIADVPTENSFVPTNTNISIESIDTFPVIQLESASYICAAPIVPFSSSGSSNTVEVATPVKGSKKTHIVLTSSDGQQIIEIDEESLTSLLSSSQILPDKELMSVVRSEVTAPCILQKESAEPEMGGSNEKGEIAFWEKSNIPLESFAQKLATSKSRSSRKTYTCPQEGCGHVFNKEPKLKAHMINHKGGVRGERAFKCSFDNCEWAFTTPYRLRRHLDTHMGRKDYMCDFDNCNRRFTTVYNLNTHKKRHKWPNSLVCPAVGCEMTFANRRKMELHLRVHDDIEAPYKCSVCGKKYYSANCIASHYRSHQYNDDDFKCPFPGCGKKYDKICRLRQHIRHHTGERPYTCPDVGCNWSFMSASKLTRHMKKHTGERKFTCSSPGCGKSFLRAEHLKGHRIIHAGIKPFECPHEDCNAKFTARSSLYVHVKKHCASRVKIIYFSCPVSDCGKKYNNKAALQQHLKKVHPNVFDADGPFDFAPDVELSVPEALTPVITPIKTEDKISDGNPEQNAILSSAAPSKSRGKNKKASTKKFVSDATELETASKSIESVLVGSLLASPMKSLELEDLMDSATLSPIDAVDGGAASCSNVHDEVDMPSRLFQENTSGSARTDYCCNHILSMRAKKWRLLQNRMRQGSMNSGEDSCQQDSNISFSSDGSQSGIDIRSPDVMLASSSFAFQDQTTENLVQNHFLPDEPSSNAMYQDDSILVNPSTFGSELAMPSSLLSDHSDSEGSEIAHDSSAAVFSTSSAVDEFAESAMSLHGLD